ncbi:two-component system sensor histidine kinase NtrB [Caloranaerobacter ferrireducens]|uniref:two-component system sensor histidine kinase NtrB n=1 Tax=Caloranaerobacter ferrireducens TaxID=1323370 RepID=UPI00084D9F71|nr:ATP-binding protein [Caloranaerobacter ferrireducens]
MKRFNKKEIMDIIFISTSIVIITMLHYSIIPDRWDIHDFHRRLFYIPIIISSFKFRLKGGLFTSIIVSILYGTPLIFPEILSLEKINMSILNHFLEIIMFVFIGTVTGFLVEADFKKKKILEIQIRKLTDLENFTQNILDSITNVLIAVDKDLKIQLINKEGRKLLDLDETCIGKGLDILFVEYDKIEKILKDVLTFDKKMNIVTKCNSKDKTNIYVKLFAYPLHNILNKIEGVVIVLEDISEIRKLENQVRRAEKLSAIGQLASGIAHEIRNPLGIIKTISQTVIKDIEDTEIKEGLEIIVHEVDRANMVIKGLLDFAKPNVNQIKIQSIDKLIKEVIMLTKKYAQQHGVKIIYTSKVDIEILIDSEKIKQAFINVIFNSVQAMPEGGCLNISLNIKDDWVKVSFEDNGTGIQRNELEKIFEPFYTTKDTGTGLGLAITHRIIDEHDGYIEVSSKPGTGTIFDVFLPIKGINSN